MTSVYFVRHAEPNYANHDDRLRELSAKGEADAALVTRYLADQQIDIVLSSPFRRAVDTVSGIARLRGLAVECIEDFRERKVDDAWIDDFDAFSKRQWADFDFKLAGGESLRETQARNLGALSRVLTKYGGMRIVVGSHGTALSTLIHSFVPAFGYDGFRAIRKLMPWIVRFDFDGESCVQISSVDIFAPGDRETILYRQ